MLHKSTSIFFTSLQKKRRGVSFNNDKKKTENNFTIYGFLYLVFINKCFLISIVLRVLGHEYKRIPIRNTVLLSSRPLKKSGICYIYVWTLAYPKLSPSYLQIHIVVILFQRWVFSLKYELFQSTCMWSGLVKKILKWMCEIYFCFHTKLKSSRITSRY